MRQVEQMGWVAKLHTAAVRSRQSAGSDLFRAISAAAYAVYPGRQRPKNFDELVRKAVRAVLRRFKDRERARRRGR